VSRILLIDDDTQVNEVLKATLEVLGHQVVAVDDPANATDAFSSFHPDVTLIDYMLPGRSGLEVLRELGDVSPHSIRYLATGMADFHLIKRALEAGASSLLAKPYRVMDLVSLMNLAALLDAALLAENDRQPSSGESLHLSCPSGDEVRSMDLAQVVAFGRAHGADDAVAAHHLPLVAGALMKNAGMYGCIGEAASYRVDVTDSGSHFRLQVSDNGPGFDWQKTVARARSCMEKPCASGLQLIMALADELHFEEEGRIACVTLGKTASSTV
jgi:CheY-like chemotaxis protein